MASVETAWPAVRLGAIGEAWRLYRRHWGVWSLTMLVAIVVRGDRRGNRHGAAAHGLARDAWRV